MARGKSPGRKSKSKTKSIEPKKNDSRSASPASPRTPLNRLLVGGQLLGNRPTLAPDHTNIVSSWDTFEPIITPEMLAENTLLAPLYLTSRKMLAFFLLQF